MMARISIDNGHSYIDPQEAVAQANWQVIVNLMDDDTREMVAEEMAPCTKQEFLMRYLELAQADLIIG